VSSRREIFRSTWRALSRPKRLIPILVVCAPMIATERYARDWLAMPLSACLCLAFVLIGPASWRWLFPEDEEVAGSPLRLVAFVAIAVGTTYFLGNLVPAVVRMKPTFLTSDTNLVIMSALFCVGGWGLGRDVGLEQSLARERARAEALSREAERAQLLALRSNLDPHFLFNTLNAIAEWCRQDGVTAERAVLQLSSMLREVLAGVREPLWPLSRELELLKTLFALHLLRDPALFTLDWHVPEGLDQVSVPTLILLPLAENAVKHGPAAGHRGPLRVEVKLEAERIEFVIENPGPYRGPRAGSDGLPTVEKRLRLAFAKEASLTLEDVGGRTRTRLTMPRTAAEGMP
jgi:signal transduction histidine kinase